MTAIVPCTVRGGKLGHLAGAGGARGFDVGRGYV